MIKLPSILIITLVVLVDITSSPTLVLAKDSRLNTQVYKREPPPQEETCIETIRKTLKQDQQKPLVRGKPSDHKPAGTKELPNKSIPTTEKPLKMTLPKTKRLEQYAQYFSHHLSLGDAFLQVQVQFFSERRLSSRQLSYGEGLL